MRCAAKGRLRAGSYGKTGEFPVFRRGGSQTRLPTP